MTGWIVVAAANHVARGRAGGFVQAGHGKEAPLRRMRPGDAVVTYSPVRVFGGAEPCRTFTAFGHVRDGEPYRADMGDGFVPWRRDVAWAEAREVPVASLLDVLDLTRGKRNWAAPFRFGLVRLEEADLDAIAAAMGAERAGGDLRRVSAGPPSPGRR